MAWARTSRRIPPDALDWLARGLLMHARVMAPIVRLANIALLAAEAPDPRHQLLADCRRFQYLLLGSSGAVARRFHHAVRSYPRLIVVTYSYSATVVKALVRANRCLEAVCCGESRTGLEGRETARQLVCHGIPVYVTTDAGLAGWVQRIPDARVLVVTGADTVNPLGFVNKGGTEMLFSRAKERGVAFWVLADSTKFLPLPQDVLLNRSPIDTKRIWKGWPRDVRYCETLFSTTPLESPVRVLSERGLMTPPQVRREIAKIRLSPRLKEMVD